MPIIADFTISRYADGILSIDLEPPIPIGGWNIQMTIQKRLGSTTPLIVKNVATGFNGVSGITITNSGQGKMDIVVRSADASGLEFGNYSHNVWRMDSGNRTLLSEGYMLLQPSNG